MIGVTYSFHPEILLQLRYVLKFPFLSFFRAISMCVLFVLDLMAISGSFCLVLRVAFEFTWVYSPLLISFLIGLAS